MDDKLDKKRFRKLANLEKQKRLRIEDFVKASMDLTQGREFMFWLMETAQIGRNPFTANALTTSFNCGELNIGQQVQALIIETSPKGYLKMLTEKEQERKDDRDTLGNNDGDDDLSPGATND